MYKNIKQVLKFYYQEENYFFSLLFILFTLFTQCKRCTLFTIFVENINLLRKL